MIDLSSSKKNKLIAIVGIGASAGGLSALKTFFSYVPDNTGLAFVVVVHLSPEHKSMLAELLQPHVKMPVLQVSKTIALKPNHVYVIPPNSNLDTIDTHLRLSNLEEKRSDRAPIDHFFRTLAKAHSKFAVGIILTGTGSDGSLGLKEIKEKGGFTIAQDPAEAEHSGMPQNAILTGMVDMVLPIMDMASYLIRFARTKPQIKALQDEWEPKHEEQEIIRKIFAKIQVVTGRDFISYKTSTILRRLQRRMQIIEIEKITDYLNILNKDDAEVKALADDFLINVTSFFRDTHVFEGLKKDIIPKIFDQKEYDQPIRVWSVGCSTGEEAYSVAILLMEEASLRDVTPSLRIFASDLHELSLKKGREGFYPNNIKADINPERLNRFFFKEGNGFRVRKELREVVTFTPHNLLRDPPFSKIDLIICRNLLIYLKREVQKDVFELFHYALNPNGFLVLGTAENLENINLFKQNDKKKSSFYSKKNNSASGVRLPVIPHLHKKSTTEKMKSEEIATLSFGGLHQKIVERFAPPSLLVGSDNQVMHVSSGAGRYLAISGGELSKDIFKLIRPNLQLDLRSLIYMAKEKRGTVRSKPIELKIDGEIKELVLSARVVEDEMLPDALLVMFDEYDHEQPTNKNGEKPSETDIADDKKKDLERKLEDSRKQLRAVIRDYETSREEMNASNEELQSINEELRSTMEELETSKEELQSVNEELTTLNQENRHKVEELSQLSDDLQNLLAATEIATLFLDKDLRILRFTPKLGDLFNIRLVDKSRPISDLTHNLGYRDLVTDAKKVLKNLMPIEREVIDFHDNTYLSRILPYRTFDDRIQGVVITFIDISARKKAEQEIEKAKEYAEKIIETLHEPLLALNPDLTVKSVNQAFYNHFHVNSKETIGKEIYELGNGQWNIPALRTLLEAVLPENNLFTDFEVEHDFEQIGKRIMQVNARRLDQVQLILLGIRDITQRKKDVDLLRQSKERLQRMVNIPGVGIITLNEDGIIIDANQSFLDMTGYTLDEVKSSDLTWKRLTPPEHLEVSIQQIERLKSTGKIGPYEKEFFRKDGSRIWIMFAGASLGNGIMIEYCLDISDRKKTENALLISESRYKSLFDSIDEGFCIIEVIYNNSGKAIDYRFVEVNPAFEKHTDLKNAQGKRMRELQPKHESYWYEIYGRIAKSGKPERFRQNARFLGGRTYDVYAFRTGKPEEHKVAVIFSDITAYIESAEALKASELRLQTFLEQIPVGVGLFDENGKVLLKNQAMDQYISESLPSEDPDERSKWVSYNNNGTELDTLQWPGSRALRGETVTPGIEFEYRIKEGEKWWVKVAAVPFRDQEGRVKGSVVVIENITTNKQSEEALAKAKEEAEKAARAKEDFLAHMSHEIRTPLNAIVGLTHLILKQDPKPEQLENLNTLKFSSENLHMLINDILDFSKIQAGKMSFIQEEIDLPNLLNSIVQVHQTGAKAKSVNLILKIDKSIPQYIIAEHLKLSQVLNNLLNNAVKFTNEGEITLKVDLDRTEEKQVWINFRVEDTGIGIFENKLQDIFDVFNQGDSSTARKYGGTGLGLTLCRMYLEMMGSKIQVKSTPGKGSVFYFTLPVKLSNGKLLKKEKAELEKSTELNDLRILLVEDADINRMVIRQFLHNWWGINCDEAIDGLQAIDMAKKKKYDLILMDIRMPVMDGFQSAENIRKDAENGNIPIIALTADISQKVRSNVDSGLFYDMIIKPVDPDQLRKKIYEIARIARNENVADPIPAQHSSFSKLKLEKVNELMKHNPDSIKVFLKKTADEMLNMQAIYKKSLEEKDIDSLKKLEHKYKWTFDLFQFTDLHDHILNSLKELKTEISKKRLEEIKDEGFKKFHSEINAIQNEIFKSD